MVAPTKASRLRPSRVEPAQKRSDQAHQSFKTVVVRFRNPSTGCFEEEEALCGDYEESGENHGRPTYLKRRLPNSYEKQVHIYFWDAPDAKDDSDENGWWFGETVGGEAVWARHTEETDEPPCTGWIVASEAHGSMELVVEVKRPLPRPSVRPSSGPTASTAVTVPSTRRVDEASDVPSDAEYVPAPWIPVYDDGPLYYWNEETGESSWEHPNCGKSELLDEKLDNPRSQLDAPNAHERNSNSFSPSPSLWQRAQDSQRHSRHDEKLNH